MQSFVLALPYQSSSLLLNTSEHLPWWKWWRRCHLLLYSSKIVVTTIYLRFSPTHFLIFNGPPLRHCPAIGQHYLLLLRQVRRREGIRERPLRPPHASDEGKDESTRGKRPSLLIHAHLHLSLSLWLSTCLAGWVTGIIAMYLRYSTSFHGTCVQTAEDTSSWLEDIGEEHCERVWCSFPFRVTLQYVEHWKGEGLQRKRWRERERLMCMGT